jgi:serine/threonine-protein kinase
MTDLSTRDTVATDSGDPLIGTTQLGRYRIARKLGQGGMGAVYEALHIKLDKRVAIKILLDKHAHTAGLVQRLEQEARLASSIGDSHIVDVADIGETDDGRTFIVMELLDGQSLGHLLARPDGIPEARIVALVAQAARALAAAHAKGVIHRDIKPENLFVLDRGGADFVKILDFGISKLVRSDADDPKLTGTGLVIGTAAYMSPEQARGDDVDHRADVYALGVVMYEAATGRLPFLGDNYLKMLRQVVSDEPPTPRSIRPAISEGFERIAAKAMAKNPDDRYADANELANALDGLLGGKVTAATTPSRPAKAAKLVRPANPTAPTMPEVPVVRRRWLVPAGLSIAAVVAIVIVMLVRGGGTVEISIVTEPPGAAILQGDKILGYTPMTYRFVRENKNTDLTAQMAGFDIACFIVNPAEDTGEIHIRMPAAGTARDGCAQPRHPGP